MKREKTQAEVRRANRGNVPGVLGMEELSRLTGRVDTVSKPHCRVSPKPAIDVHAACCRCERCNGEGNIWGAAKCSACDGIGEKR